MRKTTSVSTHFQSARTRPAGSIGGAPTAPETPEQTASPSPSSPSASSLEAANERALRSRGRPAYTPRGLARSLARRGGNAIERAANAPQAIAVEQLRLEADAYLRAGKLEGQSQRTLDEKARKLNTWYLF